MESWIFEKLVKQKMPYIENGISFSLFTFLARQVLAYCKFNTQILINVFNSMWMYYDAGVLNSLFNCRGCQWSEPTKEYYINNLVVCLRS